MTAEKLYKNGEPRFIRCYEAKRSKCPDRYCVVYTHASWIDRLYRFRAVYRGMSADPYHPLGIGCFADAWQWEFCPGGSRIAFRDLPTACQKLVLSDYAGLWGAEPPGKEGAGMKK
jgi:hypothetical protein